MDREEKKRLRKHIGDHLDVSKTRLTDDEAAFLGHLVDNYGDYEGRTQTESRSHSGWSSDGKYTRKVTQTDTFVTGVGIRHDYSFQDDDGEAGGSSTLISDARGILNWFKDHS